jgi:hypothetical protein
LVVPQKPELAVIDVNLNGKMAHDLIRFNGNPDPRQGFASFINCLGRRSALRSTSIDGPLRLVSQPMRVACCAARVRKQHFHPSAESGMSAYS